MRSFRLPLAVLFIALGHSTKAQDAAEAEVTVSAGAPLTVECALRVEQRAEWRLDGGAVPADLRPAGEAAPSAGAAGRLTARLSAPAARAHHAGVYTCSREPASQRVRVRVGAAATRDSGAGEAEAGTTGAPASLDAAAAQLVWFDVGRPFEPLNCTLAVPADTAGLPYVWKKNNTLLEELAGLKERYSLDERGAVFRLVGKAHEDDNGTYECAAGGAARRWDVRAHTVARLPPNTNVVEGQKLKLQCKLVGMPYPEVTWAFSNASEGENASWTPAEALGSRVKLQTSAQGVAEAELVVEAARREDAGRWRCTPRGREAGASVTVLRVKDMYAALWPFLGICAEVFVLCAIILVYEKRRTKPDLEDSDTDNHDQKKS